MTCAMTTYMVPDETVDSAMPSVCRARWSRIEERELSSNFAWE